MSSQKPGKKILHALAGTGVVDEKPREVESKTSLSAQETATPVELPELDEAESRLFDLVQSGNVKKVEAFFRERPGINVNCINCQGYTVLHLAVKNEDLPMIRFLVSSGARAKDTILYAVQTANQPIVQYILDVLEKADETFEKRGYLSSRLYTSDITPMILAAQLGHWSLIRLFLSRGHRVPIPHRSSCMCANCIKIMRTEGVNLSTVNLNAYKALCSPHYLLQTSSDPFLDIFVYGKCMKEAAEAEEEFRVEYGNELQKLKAFTNKLLDQCRTTEEVRIILEEKAGLGDKGNLIFPRVILALEWSEREFVTHSYVQQVLRLAWEGEFQAWNRIPFRIKCVHLISRFLLLPFIAIWINVRPATAVAKHWSSPVSKYLNAFASRLLFVLFVYLEITLDRSRSSRGPPNTGLEWLLVVWVAGYIAEEVIHVTRVGTKRYIKSMWHWYDTVTIFLFLLTFAFWIIAWVDIIQDPSEGKVPPRNEWTSLDPTLIHEAVFALSSVFTVFRLMFFFKESAKLGPLQVSLSCMIVEIFWFMVFCICVMMSFAFGLTRMYEPYSGMKRVDKDGNVVTQSPAFTTFGMAMRTLFFRMLGIAAGNEADVVVSNKDDGTANDHTFTQCVGGTLYCVYQLIMLVALINSLIAIVTGTFQKIVDNAELYWKFYRTELWLHYMNEAVVTPSPFLFLQLPFVLAECMKRKQYTVLTEAPGTRYSDVIQLLVQRYLAHGDVVLID
ncbi:short transient receptor potential channel 4-like [Ornithodoros turicata]|uniref:short transient receptor potential channel 4-like n=1 Tax=Ornithodoros turicata TaxID=34597 RepID=UPI00313945C5